MGIAVVCPNCLTRFGSVPRIYEGRRARCSKCRHRFVIQRLCHSDPGDGRVVCPSCSARLRPASLELNSGKVRCPECQRLFPIENNKKQLKLPKQTQVPATSTRPRKTGLSGSQTIELSSVFNQTLFDASRAMEQGDWTRASWLLNHARTLPEFRYQRDWLALKRDLSAKLPRTRLNRAWGERSFKAHEGGLSTICLSPDGLYILSAGWRRSAAETLLKLWDAETGDLIRVFAGHNSEVGSLCFSRNGRYILSEGSLDFNLRLWETGTGRRIFDFKALGQQIYAGWVCRGGRFILMGLDDQVHLFDVKTGRTLRSFPTGEKGLLSISVSPDERRLAAASSNNDITLWDLASGRETVTLRGHKDAVVSLKFSGDGELLLSQDRDGRVKVWDLSQDQERLTLLDRADQVDLSFDGKTILTAAGKSIRFWDAAEGRHLLVLDKPQKSIAGAAFSSQSGFVITADHSGLITRWALDWELADIRQDDWPVRARPYLHVFRARTAPPQGSLPLEREPVSEEIRRAFTRDGRPRFSEDDLQELLHELAGVGFGWVPVDKVIQELAALGDWRAPRPAVVLELVKSSGTNKDPLISVADVLARLGDTPADPWETASFFAHPGGVEDLIYTPDGAFIISAGADKHLRVWEAASGRFIRLLEGHDNVVTSVSVSSNGKLALSGGSDMTLRLWDLTAGSLIRTYEGQNDIVSSVCIGPDGSFALSAGSEISVVSETSLLLWALPEGTISHRFGPYQRRPLAIHLNPKLNILAVANHDHTLTTLKLTGEQLGLFQGHTGPVTAVFNGPQGRRLLSGSSDRTLKLWDLATGQCLLTYMGHQDEITAVQMSPDGRFVLSSSSDRTVRLWETGSGRLIRTLTGHKDRVRTCTVSPDGRQACSGGQDGYVKIWRLTRISHQVP